MFATAKTPDVAHTLFLNSAVLFSVYLCSKTGRPMHDDTHKKPDFLKEFRFAQGLVVRNRTALAPMTNCQSHSDGTLGEDELVWLRMRAEGGFGMVFTCAAHVLPEAQGFPGELGIFEDIHDAGLTRLTKTLRDYGAVSIAQLYHGGVRCPSKLTGVQPVSASSFELDISGFETPRSATLADIERIVSAFGDAARRCEKNGFDGIEIHGANGYLITQFLSTQTNNRGDAYGGALENRARLLIEIVQNIKSKVSPDFLVGLRLSPENVGAQLGLDFDESLQTAKMACEVGLHFVHLSLSDALKKPAKYPDELEGILTRFRLVLPEHIALLTSGGIWTGEQADAALAHGADVVTLGKSAIANPYWPKLAGTPGFTPDRLPMTREQLALRGVGSGFAEILGLMRLLTKDI